MREIISAFLTVAEKMYHCLFSTAYKQCFLSSKGLLIEIKTNLKTPYQLPG